VRSGWLARTRILADGRKQIILIFLPSDICGLKCMYLPRQPDAIEGVKRCEPRLDRSSRPARPHARQA
jgi:CRP-like cAMP-binding protein